ncbi:hypothetical protein ACGFX7_06225 [Streptomyces harbinensis]|uniref:hypothetical protein n=1 Tax=Streptomyces harbinensis TaxID=1176198 RepID=UPI00371CC5B1
MHSTITVAYLDTYRVPFADRPTAERVLAQWRTDHEDDVAELRADGFDRLADNVYGRLEDVPAEQWARTGPGGLAAVWDRAPQRALLHCQGAHYLPDGTETRQWVYDHQTWEFQRDSWTTAPARVRVEKRPASGGTEIEVIGTDDEAVRTQFASTVADRRP